MTDFNTVTIDGFEIQTYFSEHMPKPWSAVNMTVSIERLSGYSLTEEEKTNMFELMAGYCSLIDDYGLVGLGETEFEAIQHLFSKATKVEGEA